MSQTDAELRVPTSSGCARDLSRLSTELIHRGKVRLCLRDAHSESLSWKVIIEKKKRNLMSITFNFHDLWMPAHLGSNMTTHYGKACKRTAECFSCAILASLVHELLRRVSESASNHPFHLIYPQDSPTYYPLFISVVIRAALSPVKGTLGFVHGVP